MTSPGGDSAPAGVIKPPDGGWGWVVVVCSFFIHVVMDGMTYSFGVLAVSFVEDLGSTRQLNGWITSVLVGVTLGAGPIVSILCKKFGDRAITIVGASVACVGFAVSYFVTKPWMFIITISLVGGFGISMIYLPAIVCVGIYFDKRRSTAIGIAVCGSGLGIFIFGPFINYLIDEYTWRGAVLILAGVVLNCAVFGCLMRPLPTATPAAPAGAAVANGTTEEETQPLNLDPTQTDEASDQNGALHQRAAGDFLSLQNLHHQEPNKLSRRRSISSGAHKSIPAGRTSETADTEETPQPIMPAPLLASRSAFVAASALSLALHDPAGQNGVVSKGETLKQRKSLAGRVSEVLKLDLLKDPVFLLVIVSNLFFNVGFDAPFLYTPDRAQQAGYSDKNSSLLLSVIGIANLIGRLVFGFLSDNKCVSKTALYASSLTIAGVSLFFSFISSAYIFMAAYCALFGVFVGAYVTLTPTVLAHLLGADKLNDSFGLTLLFQGIGVLVGPPIAGALFDHYHSFNISYMASGGCMMLSGIILFPLPCFVSWLTRRRGHRGDATLVIE